MIERTSQRRQGHLFMIADVIYKRFRKALGCLLVLAFLSPSIARCEDVLKSIELKSLFYKWHTFRRYMDEKGILLETINTIDVLGTVSGGLQQRTAAAGDFNILQPLMGKTS
jgi:hypothetical protein